MWREIIAGLKTAAACLGKLYNGRDKGSQTAAVCLKRV